MTDKKNQFKKVAIPAGLKMEIAIMAAREQRREYQIVVDAINLYKKSNKKSMPVAERTATQ